jgi:hypothetical protein
LAVDDFWNIGRSGVFTMLAQLSPTTGEGRETAGSDSAIREGSAESSVGGG